MNRLEALKCMKAGLKVTHKHFSMHEYLYYRDGVVFSEDGYNFTDWILGELTPDRAWLQTGWKVL